MDTAIQVLEEARRKIRDKADKDIAELDASIARLKAGLPAAVHNQKVSPGQWKGMEPAPALQAYLNLRGGGPVSIHEAVNALEVGEADLGQSERHERNLKITITNNARTFRYDDENGTVALAKAGGKKTA